MKKKRLIKVGVLTVTFLLAIIIFSRLTNRDNTTAMVDIGGATLPRIEFQQEGYTVNSLQGYVKPMDVTTLRDSITPLHKTGELVFSIQAYENEIESVQYELLSMDGETLISTGDVLGFEEEQVSIDLSQEVPDGMECVLKLVVQIQEKPVYFYTRVQKYTSLNLKENLDFVQAFHQATFDQEEALISGSLESNAQGDASTMQHVTINSSKEQVMWGDLEPEINGKVYWKIVETNSVFTAVQLQYQVFCRDENDGEKERYNVTEFYRVRYANAGQQVFLLQYDRTMDQIIEVEKGIVTEKGLDLGVQAEAISYQSNVEGNMVAFVVERELWLYNREQDAISLIFSFAQAESNDIRNRYDEHGINIFSIDELGNMVFAVFGYMNRGEHEGEVGTAIYRYFVEEDTIREIAYISTNQSFQVAHKEFEHIMYYSLTQNILYVKALNGIYEVNLENGKQEKVVDDLENVAYVIAPDGQSISYQDDGISILNFETGETLHIEGVEQEALIPLGYLNSDFIYGYSKESEKGMGETGQEIIPMYKIEIVDEELAVQRTYENTPYYTESILVNDNMIVLHQVEKRENTYVSVGDEIITNNQSVEGKKVYLETYSTPIKRKQVCLAVENMGEDLTPTYIKAQLSKNENAIDVSYEQEERVEGYFVYAYGEMIGVYQHAKEAIEVADLEYGVVVNEKQAYVWQRGNRDLAYTLAKSSVLAEQVKGGMKPDALVIEAANGKAISYTGCTLSQICYFINHGQLIAARIDGSWSLLVGYRDDRITYINEAGDLVSGNIEELDARITGIIGDGIFQ